MIVCITVQVIRGGHLRVNWQRSLTTNLFLYKLLQERTPFLRQNYSDTSRELMHRKPIKIDTLFLLVQIIVSVKLENLI